MPRLVFMYTEHVFSTCISYVWARRRALLATGHGPSMESPHPTTATGRGIMCNSRRGSGPAAAPGIISNWISPPAVGGGGAGRTDRRGQILLSRTTTVHRCGRRGDLQPLHVHGGVTVTETPRSGRRRRPTNPSPAIIRFVIMARYPLALALAGAASASASRSLLRAARAHTTGRIGSTAERMRLPAAQPSRSFNSNTFSPIGRIRRPAGRAGPYDTMEQKLHWDLHHAFIRSCPGAIMSRAEPSR